MRERLRASPVSEQTDPDTFDRVAGFTAEILGRCEPDSVERRFLERQPERIELHDGEIRLDAGGLTSHSDPPCEDPVWSTTLDLLALQGAVSGLLVPHAELQSVPEGGQQPLQPAAAVALASVIEGGSVPDLLVLGYGDPAVATTNGGHTRTNL